MTLASALVGDQPRWPPSPKALVSFILSPMRTFLIRSVVLFSVGGLTVCSSNPSTPGTRPLPTLVLTKSAFYFTADGTPRLLMTRNITGESVSQIDDLLDQASAAGDTLIRFHLIHGLGAGVTASGTVDEAWAEKWDEVFDHAQSVGLYVAPVFAVWADWNNGTPDYGFANWSMNPWNIANGGPASDPSELWQSGSVVRAGWMSWLGALVARWQGRTNIAAWEVFSELDIATGADETSGAAFAAEAAAIVRAGDPAARPLMASLTFSADWPTLLGSESVDIVQIHPYADPLDALLLTAVGERRTEYQKPVLIGESGLSAAAPTGGTATTAANAPLDVKHAIWAGIVSGALNARALWWEDGYAIYEPPGLAFVNSYAEAEAAAAKFVSGLDFTGAAPLIVGTSADLIGGAVGNASQIVGWFRSAACSAPNYTCGAPLTGETATITAPGGANAWNVTFFDTVTGAALPGGGTLAIENGAVVIALPTVTDDVALTLTPAGG
jgi:hypothetical protein